MINKKKNTKKKIVYVNHVKLLMMPALITQIILLI